jgi:hypothetical protein
MRPFASCLLVALSGTAYAQFVPAPPAQVPGYFSDPMPCKIEREDRVKVACPGGLLDGKSLRELSILRNTIYARWGWDGYRKPWLRDYFHAQPWFKPNPKFSYKLLSEADRKNAHFIATREQSFTDVELKALRDEVYARRGKVWNDKPEWPLRSGKTVRSCKRPKSAAADEGDRAPDESRDCQFADKPWYRPDPAFSDAKLTVDDKIEIGLIDRASGSFALDDESRGKSEASLDRILAPAELRQLSLRDLRLLRNTIYARRGRPFKSQILRDHFEGMSWYKVDAAYTDKLLSANDARNVALIRSVENEFGGPLSDEDWLTEPATDGA